MKKKVLFGFIAAALVALNVCAFCSAPAQARQTAAPGGGTQLYETMCYCGGWHLRFCCTKKKMAKPCTALYPVCDEQVSSVEK